VNEPGPIALVGSGEYLPAMLPLESELIAGRPPRYVQLATAAAPEGEGSLAHWHSLGRAQAERIGVEQVVVDVRTRVDAEDPEFAEQVAGAGLIYLSGGDPGHLGRTLRDSLVWHAIEAAWRGGAALAGCSAGAMALTSWVPTPRHPRSGVDEGIGLLPHLRVLPHFDQMTRFLPKQAVAALMTPAETGWLLGIDEETALVGGPEQWRVVGRRHAWRFGPQSKERFSDGDRLDTPA
jgi:cyanophycinase-like exopeptidase